MRRKRINGTVASLAIFLSAAVAHAQSADNGVYWHIDPNVKSCSMVIDPSLTQDQWHTFVKQGAAVLSFKSLAAAAPLGKMNFELAVEYSSTPVDQHDLAWINTFTHPDADCPLGDAVIIPTLRAAVGVSDRVDVGAYWTDAPDANYGGIGAEVKYAFLTETTDVPAAAVRASASFLTGVADFNMSIYSVDLMAGKSVWRVSPYLGVKESLVVGTETTSKVELDTETLMLTQGFVGVASTVWAFHLAAEYNVSSVNTLTLLVGFGF